MKRRLKREPEGRTEEEDSERLRTVKREKVAAGVRVKSGSRNEEDDTERLRTVKREKVAAGVRAKSGSRNEEEDTERLRTVKREKVDAGVRVQSQDAEIDQQTEQGVAERRILRSKYLAVRNQINDNKDELTNPNSEIFSAMMSQVDNLHRQVQKPREQVADAEAFLDLANTLVTCVKSHSNEGLTPTDFITCLLKQFGQSKRSMSSEENTQNVIKWKDIGLLVSPAFKKSTGCRTMLGPMDTELKQRKTVVRKKRTKPTADKARPEEVDESGAGEKTDTDKNMFTMFGILRRSKRVKVESLILNRASFAQTVENLFALSFLVKDGRAEIIVDEKGSHFVSPRNAPAANSVASGDVAYSHFAFRFDFKDWKLMLDVVPEGEELMPRRENPNSSPSQQDQPAHGSQGTLPTTPIRKLSRNRCSVRQEEGIVQDSPEKDDDANYARKGKRKLV